MVIALGTHRGMTEDQLGRHLGYPAGDVDSTYPGWSIRNHEFVAAGDLRPPRTIGADRLSVLTGGRLPDTAVDVRINRIVAEADVAIVVGPVFPHEVVGFSGGNKYFFPGRLRTGADRPVPLGRRPDHQRRDDRHPGRDAGAGPDKRGGDDDPGGTPGPLPGGASGTDTLHAAAFGIPEDAWAACAAISAQTHVHYLDRTYPRVLSVMPTKYLDIWTAAKGFYKLEPIVADGGELIIYAPHITEVSVMHPGILEIGYHNRDYFLGQWERFVEPALGRPRPLDASPRAGHLGPGARESRTGSRSRWPPGSVRTSSGPST